MTTAKTIAFYVANSGQETSASYLLANTIPTAKTAAMKEPKTCRLFVALSLGGLDDGYHVVLSSQIGYRHL